MAVQRCLVSIAKEGDVELLTPLVAAISREVAKPAIAASNAFVLLEWCSVLSQNLAGTTQWEKFGKDIVLAEAEALEKCCAPASKPGVVQSALVVARRGFRKLVSISEAREKNIADAVQTLAAKNAQPSPKNAVMLGVIAGVCSRQSESKPILEKLKGQYFTFYTREIIGSKTPVPTHLAAGLSDFFSAYVPLDEFEKEIVLPLGKGLLRAPEIVLNDLITPLVQSLPKDWDLSKILQGHLLKSLLSNLKSSNVVIRTGAVTAFRVVAGRCHDSDLMDKVIDEIVSPLKGGKLASADHRVLHCEMLLSTSMSPSVAAKISAGLPAPIGKEGNETALAAETLTLSKAVKTLLSEGSEVPRVVTDAYAKGLADKKLSARRIWVLTVGDILQSLNSADARAAAVVKFAEAVVHPLFETYNEVLSNSLKSSQDGTISAAYVVCSIGEAALCNEGSQKLNALSTKFSIPKQCLQLEPKPSFLLNPRVYTKITSDDDARWLYRALAAVARSLPESTGSEIASAWTHAFLYVICSTTISPKLRKEATEALTDVYLSEPSKIGHVVINGIWNWVQGVEKNDKESAPVLAKADNSNLHVAVRSICVPPTDSKSTGDSPQEGHLEKQMCSLLVLARPRLVPRVAWIDLCLKLGLDPGELAKKHEKALLEEVVKRSEFLQPVSIESPKACRTHCVDMIPLLGRSQGSCLRCSSRIGFCCAGDYDHEDRSAHPH